MDRTTAILRRATEEAPIPADPWEGFRRRRRRRQAASRVRAAVVALVVFTGASIFLVKAFDSSVPSVAQPSVAQGGIGSTDRGGPPLAGGEEVTLAQAESMTGLLALLPDTSLASTSSITQVWARSKSPDMLVIFKSGVQAEVRRWSIAETPDEHWKALMSDGLPGSIVTLNGQDVYVMPPGGQGGTGSTNFVTADGTWVSIYGEGVASASQLLDMAATATASTPSLPNPTEDLALAQKALSFTILLPTALPPDARLLVVEWIPGSELGGGNVDIKWTSSVGSIHLFETNNPSLPSDMDPSNPKLGTSVTIAGATWVIIPTAFKGVTQIGTRLPSGVTLEIDAEMSDRNLEELAASIAAPGAPRDLPSSSPRLSGGTPILRCSPGVSIQEENIFGGRTFARPAEAATKVVETQFKAGLVLTSTMKNTAGGVQFIYSDPQKHPVVLITADQASSGGWVVGGSESCADQSLIPGP